jgi:hypothetical protein
MKFLFTALHFANYRNFESVIRALAARGHDVHLLADEEESFGGQALVERLAAEHPSVSWGWTPSPAGDAWFPVAQKVRFALDYVRYLDPRYAEAKKLRLRNIDRTPRLVRWLTSGIGGAIVGHRTVAAALKAAERLLPRSEAMAQFLETQQPDAVLLTSLTFSRSLAMDQLKVARALGMPTAACIMSWDHLSSKALVHIAPDKTIVWNDVQKHEATELHGLSSDSIVVTGAQCYDQWFEKRPTRSREEFCRAVGLDPSKPFILYVCSAMSPVPHPVEPVFVKEWLGAARASSDPTVRTAGVLVRPHPERVREWSGVSLDGFENVAVGGRTPIDSDAKADYFDSLYYSSAVVGLCTSVFLEAAIVGRPVLTLLLPAYRMHQDGMAHFRYLLTVEGGLLHTASEMSVHLAQLAEAMKSADSRDERNRRFVTAFVRPQGLDAASTPRFVDAVEELARRGRRAPDARLTHPSRWGGLVRRLAIAGGSGVGAWLLMDCIDEQRAFGERERDRQKRTVLDGRAARWAAERRARDEKLRLKQVQRTEKARQQTKKERKQQWRRWRYALGTSAPVARLKGGLKLLIGARSR